MRAHAKLLSLTVAAVGGGALILACSSGGAGTGSEAVSSVDPSKTVNGLSDAEGKQYCEDATRYSEQHFSGGDTTKIACGLSAQLIAGFGATSDADAQTKCKEQYSACLNRPSQETEADAGAQKDPCADFQARTKNCTATVGEVNQCLADTAAALKALAARDFCAEAKVSSADAGTSQTAADEQPASCKALEAKCPGLLSGDDSDDSASGSNGTDG